MDSATQRRLRMEISEVVRERRTSITENVRLVPCAEYIDPERQTAERQILFRRYPLAVALSCRLPDKDDFVTEDVAGLPVLIVRGEDGRARAFLNVCPHRGNTLATEASGHKRRIVCGYHAWSFSTDGVCRSFADKAAFGGLDPGAVSLVELPSEERHGFVWVVPTVGAQIDVASHLGAEMDSELAEFGLGTQFAFVEDTLPRRFNWKLAMDSFQEVFHVNILHKDSLKGLFNGFATLDTFGLHYRYTTVRRSFDDTVDDAPETPVLPHTSIVYLVFPNTLLIWQMDHVELWSMYPAAGSDTDCVMRVTLVVPEPPDERATRYWNRNWEVLQGSVWKEDFDTQARIQRNLESGALRELVFGRNEAALQHFHASLNAALADGDWAPTRIDH